MSPTVRALALGLTLTLAFFGLLLGRETGSRVTDGRVQSIGHFASQEELVVERGLHCSPAVLTHSIATQLDLFVPFPAALRWCSSITELMGASGR